MHIDDPKKNNLLPTRNVKREGVANRKSSRSKLMCDLCVHHCGQRERQLHISASSMVNLKLSTTKPQYSRHCRLDRRRFRQQNERNVNFSHLKGANRLQKYKKKIGSWTQFNGNIQMAHNEVSRQWWNPGFSPHLKTRLVFTSHHHHHHHHHRQLNHNA